MKKIFLLLTALIILAAGCFAATYPRWKVMPVKVYIPPYGDYTVLMKRAFSIWESMSNGTIKFKYVARQADSDIYIGFVDHVTACNDGNSVGCAVSTTTNGYFVQNYIEIGTKDTRMVSVNGKIQKRDVQRSPEHIYGVMLHEIGHALGLGHSEDPDSLMYAYDREEFQKITKSDLKLLYDKYR